MSERQPPAWRVAVSLFTAIPAGVNELLDDEAAALAAVPRPPLAAAVLVLAEVTGRVSVVIATAAPAARAGGFGALVADRTTAAERLGGGWGRRSG